MNMTKTTIVALATMAISMAHAATFETIPFNQPTYSDEDPLGVAAITNVERRAETAYNEATNAVEVAGQASSAASEAATTANNAHDSATNANAIAQVAYDESTNAYQLASSAALDAEQAQTKSTQATNDASIAQARANEIGESLDEFKGSMTNAVRSSEEGVVVVGSVRGANTDVGMLSNSNSIVFAVDRDVEEMQAESGQIFFAADSAKFDIDLGDIYFGSSSLRDLLGGAGGSGGESNVIVTVKVNGTALVPDADRAIDITIPSAGDVNTIESISTNGVAIPPDGNKNVNIVIPTPGEGNVIESITTNGVALPVNGKSVEIPLQDYVRMDELQDGIVFGTMTVSNLTINGKKPSVEGHTHDDKLDATNGVAYGDLKVYPMPSGTVGQTHTIITHESISIGDAVYREEGITYNGETYEFNSDTNGLARLKDVVASTNNITITTSQVTDLTGLYSIPGAEQAATNCINAIQSAETISEIKTALVDFLNTFKKPTE